MKDFAVENLTVSGVMPLSFELEAGAAIALHGPSGVGKTRLLRALADLEPHGGGVSLDGRAQADVSPAEWRRQVALVPADSAWWHPCAADHFDDWPAPGLEALGLSPAVGDQPVEQLSSGERQRLALLRALAREPRVLLLDEPAANLDADNGAAMERFVADWRGGGGMVVWVTHAGGQRARVAERSLAVTAA